MHVNYLFIALQFAGLEKNCTPFQIKDFTTKTATVFFKTQINMLLSRIGSNLNLLQSFCLVFL